MSCLLINCFFVLDSFLFIFSNRINAVSQFLQSVPGPEKDNCETILDFIYETSKQNKLSSKFKRTFVDEVRLYSAYLFLTAGRKAYENLYANFSGGIPCSTTIRNFISENRTMKESKLDLDGLLNFLNSNDSTFDVFVSEDQTRVTSKIRYDSNTKCLVGFVGPYNKNGLPDTDVFKVVSAVAIQNCFKIYKKANYVNVIMVQPMSAKSEPFCIGLYGTDNKFSYVEVCNRWRFIEAELGKKGIRVRGFSSDGDTRLLKAMKIFSGLGTSTKPENQEWFNVSFN